MDASVDVIEAGLGRVGQRGVDDERILVKVEEDLVFITARALPDICVDVLQNLFRNKTMLDGVKKVDLLCSYSM